MQPEVHPLALALMLILCFSAAGIAHVVWLRSSGSRRFMSPVDRGSCFRGRRIFGANKTWRGFMVMVPATGLAFLLFALLRGELPSWWADGLWQLSPVGHLLAGMWAGLGFMLGEFPNSFVKRQLGIRPGCMPEGTAARAVFYIVDRVDSILGMLLALVLVLPVPAQTWLLVLLIGPGIHLGFSATLFRLNLKARLA